MLCAPNAFKGTLTAHQAAAAMADGVRDAGASPDAVPVADGGDGTLDVLLEAAGSHARVDVVRVTGPLGAPTAARLGWIEQRTAVVELAEAAGLRLLGERRDALHATSRGAGELIAAALAAGASRVIVGVGGSACTDGGAGLLQALGVRLSAANGDDVGTGGDSLLQLERIDVAGLFPALRDATIEVAVDVRNPLLGPDGAASVFGPQKGASDADVATLERALQRLASVAERDCDAAGMADMAGAGAAGGCGFALALIGATLLPGAALICDVAGIDDRIAASDMVLTGEGRLDAQTAFGKAPAEVGERCARAGVRCAAVAGTIADPLGGLFDDIVALDVLAGADEDPRRDAALLLRRAASLLVTRGTQG